MNKYVKTMSALSRVYDVHKLFMSDEIRNLIGSIKIDSPLIPTGPVVHTMSRDLMIPGGYYGLPPHQDYPSMQSSLDSVIVWVPLVNIDKNFYPLEVIPQSHRDGMLPGKVTEKYYEIDPSCYRNEDFLPVEVEAGDVVLMSSFTIHRSGTEGRRNDVRISCSIRFDNAEEETFITRTYPTVYKRTVDRAILEKDFPTKEQVQEIFNRK
jgi:ectoine hydroxylase-related dioxygenase (phytanoyl-CoA dioxygenase family)